MRNNENNVLNYKVGPQENQELLVTRDTHKLH